MRIGLFTSGPDPIADRLEALARARGAEALRLPLDGTAPLAFDGERWIVAQEDLEDFDGFVLRRIPAAGSRLAADPGAQRSAEDWWRMGVDQLERASTAESLLLDLERLGRPLVNPLRADDKKPAQLAALIRAGFPVPRTLVTNFGPAAKIFAQEVGEVVVKPVAGGGEARLLAEVDPGLLIGRLPSPAIFQERVHGADVRVTVVAGRVLSAVQIPSQTLDYRSGSAYRAGTLELLPHPLPPAIAELCTRAAALLGQVLSGIDLKRTAAGEYRLLEANSAPVYLDIEVKTGAPISEAILDYLLGAAVR